MAGNKDITTVDNFQFEYILMQDSDGKSNSGYRLLACDNIGKKAIIPNKVKGRPVFVIGSDCFARASEMEEVVFPADLQVIEERAFRFSKLAALMLPNSVNYIGTAAFEGCEHLVTVTCGTQLQQIGPFAFLGCTELRTVKRSGLANNLALDAWSFANCPLLHEIDLNSVTLAFECFAGNPQWQEKTVKPDHFIKKSKERFADGKFTAATKLHQIAEHLYENHDKNSYAALQARRFAKILLPFGILVIIFIALFVSSANRNQQGAIPSEISSLAITAAITSPNNTSTIATSSTYSAEATTMQSFTTTTTTTITMPPTTSRPTTGTSKPTTTSRPTTTLPPVVRVSSVSINSGSRSVYDGASGTLTATVYPYNAADTSVTWSSGNSFCVAIKSNGEWKALRRGQATITVKTNEGGHTDSIVITVN